MIHKVGCEKAAPDGNYCDCASPKAKRGDWINTFSGHQFFPLDDDPGPIEIRDIAHALSNLCRYNGHGRFYSVAEHCVRLASFFRFYWRPELPSRALVKYALLHDASEAYIADVPRPLKKLPEFAFYREVEAKLQATIYKRFGLEPVEPAIVREMDTAILGAEAPNIFERMHPAWDPPEPHPDMFLSGEAWGWEPWRAEVEFLGWARDIGIKS